MKTTEQIRLDEAREQKTPWKKWGTYISERQWGAGREDYSDNGNAWDYFRYDRARSRAYYRGEDSLAGISDDKQRLCFALALWNGEDPIIKERLFGFITSEDNPAFHTVSLSIADLDPKRLLEAGKRAGFIPGAPGPGKEKL